MKKIFNICAAMLLFAASSFAQVCDYDPQIGIIKIYKEIPGALSGRFTVNSSGDKVLFSKGNLQYQASTKTWRFAEHQYDCVGDGTNGNVYENEVKCNNALISSSYSGWIDMFGWGTSGWKGTGSPARIAYQPYEKSTTNSDYGVVSPRSSSETLTSDYANADWGVFNASQLGSGWRALTSAEWEYLFFTRTTTSGIRYAKATVNSVTGIILLPDDWSTEYHTLSNTNKADAVCSSNVISLSNWTDKLEAHGAVFIPAAGNRDGTTITSVFTSGAYWSSTAYDANNAYFFYVHSTGNTLLRNYERHLGYSVRLVHASPTR